MPFEVFAHERNINIITYFRLCTPFWIFDVEYMRKAIINLISNAVKFTPDYGKISLYVASLTDKDNHTWLFIDIKDTGNGIVPEDIERIFERFYQSKKSIKYPVYGQSSTGIGLFLCKKIISLHGGNIYAGNNPKQGAFFRILLPLESRMNTHFPFLPMETRKRKPSSLLKIMQICVLIFVPFSKTIIN